MKISLNHVKALCLRSLPHEPLWITFTILHHYLPKLHGFTTELLVGLGIRKSKLTPDQSSRLTPQIGRFVTNTLYNS